MVRTMCTLHHATASWGKGGESILVCVCAENDGVLSRVEGTERSPAIVAEWGFWSGGFGRQASESWTVGPSKFDGILVGCGAATACGLCCDAAQTSARSLASHRDSLCGTFWVGSNCMTDPLRRVRAMSEWEGRWCLLSLQCVCASKLLKSLHGLSQRLAIQLFSIRPSLRWAPALRDSLLFSKPVYIWHCRFSWPKLVGGKGSSLCSSRVKFARSAHYS